jgi:palmitoyltransferase ZDHHC9/14/18
MTGPSPRNLLGTFFLVSVPSVFFNVFVVPDVASATHVVVLAIGIAWPVWCLFNLIAAGTTDPGIVRRRPKPPPSPDGRLRPRYRSETLPNGRTVTVKWNDTCNIYQPPRAHHCSANDDCVDKFDHHCPWVGTTIGRRNYRSFIFFVFGTTLLCAYVVGMCGFQIRLKYDRRPDTKRRALQSVGDAPAALALLIVAFLGFWFVAVLSGFHGYLICTNQTTYENFRDGYGWKENPHNRGVFLNCWEVFCSPTQASRFRFEKPRSAQPPDLDLARAEEAERAEKDERRAARAEREARRGREAGETSETSEASEASARGSVGDVELGAVAAADADAEERVEKLKKRSSPKKSRRESRARTGGVVKSLAVGSRALEDIRVEIEESGYEGDRDKTPKARDDDE